MLLRKKKGFSQADLGKLVGTSGDIIGRYEREVMSPGIDVIIKIASTLDVSIDYLVGKTTTLIDKQILERIEEISKLAEDEKSYVFNLIDMCLRDFNAQKAYAR